VKETTYWIARFNHAIAAKESEIDLAELRNEDTILLKAERDGLKSVRDELVADSKKE
jgi:hypothetical protein